MTLVVNQNGAKYALDPTGKHPDNRVDNEPHVVSEEARFILMVHGAFFTESVRITHQGNNLEFRKDFTFREMVEDAVKKVGKDIANCIYFHNKDIVGEVLVTYQTVGGEWSRINYDLDMEASLEVKYEKPIFYADVIGTPDELTYQRHMHDIHDVYGFGPLYNQLSEIPALLRKRIIIDNHPFDLRLSKLENDFATQPYYTKVEGMALEDRVRAFIDTVDIEDWHPSYEELMNLVKMNAYNEQIDVSYTNKRIDDIRDGLDLKIAIHEKRIDILERNVQGIDAKISQHVLREVSTTSRAVTAPWYSAFTITELGDFGFRLNVKYPQELSDATADISAVSGRVSSIENLLDSTYSELRQTVAKNKENIEKHDVRLTTNETNIATNRTDIDSVTELANGINDLLVSSYDDLRNTVTDNVNRLTTLETEHSKLSSKVSVNSANISELRNDLSETNTNVASNRTDILNNATDITNLDNRVTTSEQDINNLEGRAGTIENRLDGHDSSISTINNNVSNNASNIENNKNSISTLNARVNGHDGNISAINNRIDKNITDISNNGSKISALTTRVTNNETRLDDHATTITALDTRVSNNRNDISVIGPKLDALVTTVSDAGDNSATAIADLTSKINDNKTLINQVKGTADKNTGDIANHTSQITQIKKDVAGNRKDINAISLKVDGINNLLDDTYVQLTAQVNSNTSTLTQVQSDAKKLTTKVGTLQNQLNDIDNTVTTQGMTLNTHNTKITANTNAINKLKPKVDANTSGVAKNKTDISDLKKKVATNISDIADLKKKTAANRTDIDTMKPKLNKAITDITNIGKQVTAIDNRVINNTTSITNINNTLASDTYIQELANKLAPILPKPVVDYTVVRETVREETRRYITEHTQESGESRWDLTKFVEQPGAEDWSDVSVDENDNLKASGVILERISDSVNDNIVFAPSTTITVSKSQTWRVPPQFEGRKALVTVRASVLNSGGKNITSCTRQAFVILPKGAMKITIGALTSFGKYLTVSNNRDYDDAIAKRAYAIDGNDKGMVSIHV